MDGHFAIYVRWLFRAGVTCPRYTVLISPRKDQTVHCCNPDFIGSQHVWYLQTSFTDYQPDSLLFVFIIWCIRISQKLDLLFKCDCPVWTFLLPSFFNFSGSFYSLPFAFHMFSGCPKKLGVNYDQGLEMGPQSIIAIMDHFAIIFAPQLMTLFLNLLHQNAVRDIQNRMLSG